MPHKSYDNERGALPESTMIRISDEKKQARLPEWGAGRSLKTRGRCPEKAL